MKGRGVYLKPFSDLSLYSGNITGNNTDDHGGGVYLDGSFFYMYGGSITDNSANNGGGVAGRVSNYKVNGGYVVGRLLMLGGTRQPPTVAALTWIAPLRCVVAASPVTKPMPTAAVLP